MSEIQELGYAFSHLIRQLRQPVTPVFHYGQGHYGTNKKVALNEPYKVFNLKHSPTALSVLGEEAVIAVEYYRPNLSKNARIKLAGTSNIELIDHEIDLVDSKGEITARYRLTGKGYDVITITISGEQNGENHSYSSRVYVMAKE